VKERYKLYNGDCLEIMKDIPDKSIDMILCDLPYEVLCKNNLHAQWDRKIPFDKLWEQYNRVIKDNGAIVLFAQGMFTAELMISNPKMWRYNLV
jgi:DNA modification methylase